MRLQHIVCSVYFCSHRFFDQCVNSSVISLCFLLQSYTSVRVLRIYFLRRRISIQGLKSDCKFQCMSVGYRNCTSDFGNILNQRSMDKEMVLLLSCGHVQRTDVLSIAEEAFWKCQLTKNMCPNLIHLATWLRTTYHRKYKKEQGK